MALSETDKRYIRISIRIELLDRLHVISMSQRNDAESMDYVGAIERTLVAALKTFDTPRVMASQPA